MALAYLANRFFYRIIEFSRHWYVGGFFVVSHRTLNLLESLDRRLAFWVTLRNFFKPLYQDYTFVGYIWGIVFRGIRLFIATIVYFFILVLAVAIYVTWATIPVLIFYRIFKK